MTCVRCGRTSHTAHDCYAKTYKDGTSVRIVNYVYSINLEGGRKYVGKTNDIKRRMDEHFSGNGSAWTKKYKPTNINHVQVCKSEHNQAKAETTVYKKMSAYHGMKVVRGAGHTSSGCARCGRESHNSRKCYARVHKDGRRIDD